MTLRVLMITSEWPTPGGTPRTTHFIKRQAEFLQAAGVDVEVFHFHGGRHPRNYVRAWVEARRRLARGAYDLVHAQFGQSGLVALPCPVPLLVTLRGDDLQGIIGDDLRVTPAGRVLRRLTRDVVARAADTVIVVSDHMRALLPPAVRTAVIPSGLDLERFRPMPREEARARLGVPDGRRLVAFVGKPATARKRYPLARAAVDLVDPSLGAELLVVWGVPHDQVPVHLGACDALIFTSMQEGSPNAVKEALACDLPVVATPVGDVAERLAGVAGCELCADGEPASLAAALERVLRRGTRVAGHAAVADLDERRLTQRVIALYEAAVTRRRAADATSHRSSVPAGRRQPAA